MEMFHQQALMPRQAVVAESSMWLASLLRIIFPKRTVQDDILANVARRLLSQGQWWASSDAESSPLMPPCSIYDIRDAIHLPDVIEYLMKCIEEEQTSQEVKQPNFELVSVSTDPCTLWESLPEEIWSSCILLELRARDVMSCSSVSKHWNQRCSDDTLWRRLFHRSWKVCVLRGSTELPWMSIYIFFYRKFRSSRSCTAPLCSHPSCAARAIYRNPETKELILKDTKWKPVFASGHMCSRYQPVIFNAAILGNQSTVFEFRVSGLCQVGVIASDFFSTIIGYNGVGDDPFSYAFDGERCRLWHNGYVTWGRRWKHGDIVGVAVDVSDSIVTLRYFLNGVDLGVGQIIDKQSSFAHVNAASGIAHDSALRNSAALFPAISCFGGHYASIIAINVGPELSYPYPQYTPLAATKDWALFKQQQRNIQASNRTGSQVDDNGHDDDDFGEIALVRQKIAYCELRDNQPSLDEADIDDFADANPPQTPITPPSSTSDQQN